MSVWYPTQSVCICNLKQAFLNTIGKIGRIIEIDCKEDINCPNKYQGESMIPQLLLSIGTHVNAQNIEQFVTLVEGLVKLVEAMKEGNPPSTPPIAPTN